MLKILVAIAAALLPALAPGAEAAGNEAVKQAIESRIGGNVDAVSKAGFLGLYEVHIGDRLVYTDEKAEYIFSGSIIDSRTRTDLTQERLKKLSAIPFGELPLDLAVKTVKGDGKRVIAIFEDPNCGYCKRLARELHGLDNVTVYTFLLPILSADSEKKSKAVWCAPDRARAWSDLMLKGIVPPDGSCDTPLAKIMAFARQHRIQGTPTLFLAGGERLVGAIPLAQLEKALAPGR